jgi:hypothetical protein
VKQLSKVWALRSGQPRSKAKSMSTWRWRIWTGSAKTSENSEH